MTTFGYFLSTEEHPTAALVDQAVRAEEAGFASLWVSDHYHPWTDEQGHAPFVWTLLGAVAVRTSQARVTTAVTCPTVRTHPAVVAQAAATTAELMAGRFALGVGTGEALNEHVVGARWPTLDVRLEMLEEAVEVMRALWTGEVVRHRGRHYEVDTARLYTLPDQAPEVLVSGFGPKATAAAARFADGWVTTQPDADGLRLYRDGGGRGRTEAGVKVCWAPTAEAGRETYHRFWAHAAVPGEAAQVLPSPQHFEQLGSVVSVETATEGIACGPDVADFVAAVQPYVDAGFDVLHLSQVGPDQEGFFRFWERELAPALGVT